MKRVRVIGASVLLLLLGTVAPTYAQQEQDTKPPKQEQKAKPARQEQKQQPKVQQNQQRQQQQRGEQQAKTQQNQQRQQQQQAKVQQNEQRQQQQRGEQQAKTQQNQQRQQQQQAKMQQNQQRQQQRGEQQQQTYRPSEQERGQQQAAWQDHRSRDWQSEHRSWQERGGYNGYRIPDDRYRGYFGQDHSFRLYGLPEMVVDGYPRFQYEGLWFSLVDPWPEAWSSNWYDNDDVYVVYAGGGYYLYDRSYPGVGLAVTVYTN